MDLPEAYRHEDPSLMDRLTAGLELVDESLYRQWVMEHAEQGGRAGRDGDEEPRLDFHSWRQETALLLDLRNYAAMLVNSRLEDKAKPMPMIRYPGTPQEGGGDTGKHATTLQGLKSLVAGV